MTETLIAPRSKKDRKNLQLRMYPDLSARLQIQAVREGRSLSDLIEELGIAYLDRVNQS